MILLMERFLVVGKFFIKNFQVTLSSYMTIILFTQHFLKKFVNDKCLINKESKILKSRIIWTW